jgi:hypothetical protein
LWRAFGAISDTGPRLCYKPQILSELWGIIIDSSGVSFASTKRLRKAPAEDVEQAEIFTGMTILVKWNHGMRPESNMFLLQCAMRKQPNCNNSHDACRDRWN